MAKFSLKIVLVIVTASLAMILDHIWFARIMNSLKNNEASTILVPRALSAFERDKKQSREKEDGGVDGDSNSNNMNKNGTITHDLSTLGGEEKEVREARTVDKRIPTVIIAGTQKGVSERKR